jgi:hypothetical protein
MAKPLPEKNPLKNMRHVSPFASSEPIVIEVVEFSTPQEYDSEDPLHICEGERFDLDRESTLSFHDASLEMEKSWAMEIYEVPTLEFKGNDSI